MGDYGDIPRFLAKGDAPLNEALTLLPLRGETRKVPQVGTRYFNTAANRPFPAIFATIEQRAATALQTDVALHAGVGVASTA